MAKGSRVDLGGLSNFGEVSAEGHVRHCFANEALFQFGVRQYCRRVRKRNHARVLAVLADLPRRARRDSVLPALEPGFRKDNAGRVREIERDL